MCKETKIRTYGSTENIFLQKMRFARLRAGKVPEVRKCRDRRGGYRISDVWQKQDPESGNVGFNEQKQPVRKKWIELME